MASFAEPSGFYSMLSLSLRKNKMYMVSIFITVQENLVAWSSVGLKRGLNTILNKDKIVIRA